METKDNTADLLNPLALNEMVRQAHGTAKEKGWHDPGMEKTVGDDIALMHSELSEALEDFRAGHKPNEIYLEGAKPCGIPIELADVIIRIGDFCGKHGIDLEEAVTQKLQYNRSRPHRHGGKIL